MTKMKGNSGAAATTMIMGAPYSDGLKGAAFICARDFNTRKWEFKTRLAESAEKETRFRTDVAMSPDGKLAVVGAPYMSRPNKSMAGQLFIYKLNGSTWQKVSSPNTEVQSGAMEVRRPLQGRLVWLCGGGVGHPRHACCRGRIPSLHKFVLWQGTHIYEGARVGFQGDHERSDRHQMQETLHVNGCVASGRFPVGRRDSDWQYWKQLLL